MQHTIKINVSDTTDYSAVDYIGIIRLPITVNNCNTLYEDYEQETSRLCRIENYEYVFDDILNYTITYDIEGNIIITFDEEENK